jgi:RimJ/RimL family protein N-acetyltransferase
MPFPESLEIAGAQLRRWEAERDLDVLEAMRSDDDVTRFLQFLLAEEDLSGRSQLYAGHWDEFGHGLWAVRLEGGAPGGWIGAVHPCWHPEYAHEVELAWGLVRPAWGRGIATRAARAAAEGCFDGVGLPNVIAFIDPANTRSRSVADRLGFRATGTTTVEATGVTLDVLNLTPADLP